MRAARRRAALGPAGRRPGRGPGRRLRWPAGLPPGGDAGPRACGSTRSPSRSTRPRPCRPRPAWSATTGRGGTGEGGELAGVRPFAPGDRLRRIDWRVSLRTRDLHVASTLSDRDAEVLLLLDVLGEVGVSGGVAGSASVLDTTVRAAAAIAEHYLQRGDRVSLLEYGAAARRLRPATGRRQYLTVLEWLLDVRADPVGRRRLRERLRPHHISSDALVMVLTPLVDPRSADMLAQLTQSGRYVVAVDTLPAGARPGGGQPVDAAGHPAVADGAGERARPAARARRTGGGVGRGGQPRPGAARRGPARVGAPGALMLPLTGPHRAGAYRVGPGHRRAVPGPLRCRRLRAGRDVGGLAAVAAGRPVLRAARCGRALSGAGSARPGRHAVPRWSCVAGWLVDTVDYDSRSSCGGCWPSPRCSTSGTR